MAESTPDEPMRLDDLPDDCLRRIDQLARKPGDDVDDLWLHMTMYDHRIRTNRFVTQLVLTGVRLNEVEYQRSVDKLRDLGGVSTYSRTEENGTRTYNIIGLGHHVVHSLLRGVSRNNYSLIDHHRVSFYVEEQFQARLAHVFNGITLTMITPPDSVQIGGHGRPTVRCYDVRISGRRCSGSKALMFTSRRYKSLLASWFSPFLNVID